MTERIHVFSMDYTEKERYAAAGHFLKDRFITANQHVNEFEKQFKNRLGRGYAAMTNSGSSAVEVAIAALKLPAGTKVITPAVTFATTVSPLIRHGLLPVFIDVEEGTYNIDPQQALDAAVKEKVDVCVIPHTLGNPVDPNLWGLFSKSVEDACDALDSSINGKLCGTFGDYACYSFFAAHHMSTGQGGIVVCDDELLARTVYKFISWGRDCWCRAGQDSLCGERFDYVIDGIEYDHKYIFSEAGYNVAPLDVCGVIGKEQLANLDAYKETRKGYYDYLHKQFEDIDDLIVRPKTLPGADVNWFAYPITLKRGNRKEIMQRIYNRGVDTRLLFGGNITRQPMFKGVKTVIPYGLEESDRVMRDAFMLPCNHVRTPEEIEKVALVTREEVKRGCLAKTA